MRYALASLLLILAIPAAAAELTVEERLSRLEREVAALRAENDALRKQLGPATPALPAAPKTEAPAAQTEKRLRFGGLVQAQMEGGDAPDSRFSGVNDRVFVRRARITAEGQVVPHTNFQVELDLAGSLSAGSGLRARMTDGYFTWTRHPWASFRAGQFKTPFGAEQLVSDPRLLAPERSLASDQLTPGRQLGVQLFGDAGRITYAVGAFNGNGTGRSDNDDNRFLTAARLTGTLFSAETPAGKVRWTAGVNGYRSRDRSASFPADFGFDSTPSSAQRDAIFAGSRRGSGIDSQLVVGRGEIWTEYLRTDFDPDNAIPTRSFRSNGWSVLGAWTVIPDRLQAVGRLERFDPNEASAGDATRLWSTGANWLVKGNDLKLQLFYLRGRTAGRDQGRVIARVQTVF